MIELIHLADEPFMPHGHYYFWDPFTLFSYAISDSVIALAYFSVSLASAYIYVKRKDFTYRWMLVLFAIFMAGSGIIYVLDVITIWKPIYQVDVLVRIMTAIASIALAVVMVKFTPKLLALPSTKEWKALTEELQSANEALQAQIQEMKEKDKTIKAYQEFERLIESLPQLVWTTNPYMRESKSMYINRRWYEYTGISSEKDFHQIYRESVPEQQQEEIEQHWQHCLSTYETFERELLLKRYDGQYRWHLSKAVYSRQTNHWIGTFTDIHDQKMDQQQLEYTLDKLHDKNFELDQFVYKISHDLRAPLSTILGLVTVLKAEKEQVEKTKYIELIENRVFKLDRFIKSMLDYSRNTRTTIHYENVDVKDLLEECLHELEYMNHYSRLAISISIVREQIVTDRFRLKIIVSNLLSNAIKYQDFAKGQSELSIRVSSTLKEYLIKFKDNGIGIGQAYQDRIFNMFFRASEHAEGSGLGLYIVKQALEILQGSIQFNSVSGVGTEFIVSLPVITPSGESG